jgi:hypothetical protein
VNHYRKHTIYEWMALTEPPQHKHPKVGAKYTTEDAEKLSVDYDANFKKLLAAVGTPDHDIYRKEERRLNELNIRIQKDLGTYIAAPNCPDIDIACERCTKKHCHIRDKKVKEDTHNERK